MAGAATLLSGNCSGQPFIAADYATNPTYAAGWSAGQNGGYGFGPWSTNGTGPSAPIMAAIDHTSPYNPFGVAWTLYDLQGAPPGATSPGTRCVNGDTGTDIARMGRAILGGLQPGQTFSTVIANPNTRAFFRGYTIVLSTGSDNISYSKVGDQIDVGTFQYSVFDGTWYTTESYPTGRTSLLDTDTTTNGMQLDIAMTGTNTYHLVMTPLGNPGIAWSEDGTLKTNGPINWVTYQIYNTDSNFYPDGVLCGPDRTDFYIRSMTITGLTLNIQRSGTNVLLIWPTNFPVFNLESTLNLGPAAVWTPVSPPPSVVNGQNVVTNSVLTAHQQFYRLHYQF